jgi:hypothetical protein
MKPPIWHGDAAGIIGRKAVQREGNAFDVVIWLQV